MWTEPIGIAVLEEFAERAFHEQYDSKLSTVSFSSANARKWFSAGEDRRRFAKPKKEAKSRKRQCMVCGTVFEPKWPNNRGRKCSIECAVRKRLTEAQRSQASNTPRKRRLARFVESWRLRETFPTASNSVGEPLRSNPSE